MVSSWVFDERFSCCQCWALEIGFYYPSWISYCFDGVLAITLPCVISKLSHGCCCNLAREWGVLLLTGTGSECWIDGDACWIDDDSSMPSCLSENKLMLSEMKTCLLGINYMVRRHLLWWWFFTFTQASESEGDMELTLLCDVTCIALWRYAAEGAPVWSSFGEWGRLFDSHLQPAWICVNEGDGYVLPIHRQWCSCTLDAVHVGSAKNMRSMMEPQSKNMWSMMELQYLMQAIVRWWNS